LTVAVDLNKVSKKYRYLSALRDLSLSVTEGESVAILGPNGAGKTTLMKIAAAHILPTSGTVTVFGKNALKNSEETRKCIGFSTHECFLYDELTIEENLRFYAHLFSVGVDNIHDTIEALNLRRWFQVPVKNLSYGLRKRADIVRTLIHKPDLILLDELFAGLDDETCSLFVEYLKNQQPKALLISSHSIEWVKKLSRREIFLKDGVLVRDTAFE
jgi:ABC-type multidrug transport system ATPase subunit